MKSLRSRWLAAVLVVSLLSALVVPASAFWKGKESDEPYVSDFSKNGLIGDMIAFSNKDFKLNTGDKSRLTRITIRSLPDPGAGMLVIGGQPLEVNSVVDSSALSGLRFQSCQHPTVTTTAFTFTPEFSSGKKAKDTTVTIQLLTQSNEAPIARNMDLSTYKNIAITGYFDAVDGEGDALSFQLTSTPARGAVKLAEDGSSQFVYTPYENKTGSGSFTYVAVDPAGNTSPEARITVRIEKADTAVTYADLNGHSAHKAAIHLAEQGIYVGQRVNGRYFFDPDAPVSRAEFLTMAMSVAGLEPMDGVTTTGFYDDDAIPTWAKGSVSAALKAGAIRGSRNQDGAPVFGADTHITHGEATVMLNKLLNISDVPVEVFCADSASHWAAQAAANLTASGVIRGENAGVHILSTPMTRGEAAEMLDGALDLLAARTSGGPLPW